VDTSEAIWTGARVVVWVATRDLQLSADRKRGLASFLAAEMPVANKMGAAGVKGKMGLGFAEATRQIIDRATAGQVTVIGIEQFSGDSRPIRPEEWNGAAIEVQDTDGAFVPALRVVADGRSPQLWTNLKFRIDEVFRAWPPTDSAATGLVGRPSMKGWILAEHAKRRESGALKKKVSTEAQYLSEWLPSAHPGERQYPEPGAIENIIREVHRKAWPSAQ
jgi:hypothetical protein